MNNYLKKKLFITLDFIVLAIISQMIMYLWFGWGLFAKYFMMDIAVIFAIAFAIFLCKYTKTMNTIFSIILAFEWIIIYINFCVYESLGDVFSINMLVLVGETVEVLTFEMFPIIPFFILLALVAIWCNSLVIIGKIFTYTKEQQNEINKNLIRLIVCVILSFSLALMSASSLFIKKDKEFFLLDDKYLYESFSSPKDAIKKFGLFTFYTQEIARKIYNPYLNKSFNKNDLDNYLETSEYDNTSSSLYNICDGQNVLMIMGESFEWYAISKELTPTLYALANGYDFSSGLEFYDVSYDEEGNALLIYDAEKYDVTKEKTFGMTMTSYYSKAKTDYSEATSLLGNYPYNQSFTNGGNIFGGISSSGIYSSNDYSFTLPNMLKNNNKVTTTKYFHNYMKSFYGREYLMPRFGFDSTQFIEDVEGVKVDSDLRLSHCVLDSEMVAKYKEEMMPKNETFFTYMTTVTTHGEYTTINPLTAAHYEYLDKYINYLWKSDDPTPDSNSGIVRTYLAACLDTEWMMTIILDYLINNDLYDNTLIVFFSDHASYYSSLDKYYKPLIYSKDGYTLPGDTEKTFNIWATLNGENEEYTINTPDCPTRWNVPCFYYSTKINNSTITNRNQFNNKFSNSFDITPTVLTLLGIDYDENNYIGYPTLCADYNGNNLESKVYVSKTGGMFNKKIFSSDGLNYEFKSQNVTDEDLFNFKVGIQNTIYKHIMISLMYQYDTFKRE